MDFLKKLWADGKVKNSLIAAATAVAIFTAQYFGWMGTPAPAPAPAPVVAPAEK